METQLIYTLTNNFEDFTHTTDNGVEFWLARDLQKLLAYTQRRNFELVIKKEKTACELSGQEVSGHFADVSKTIDMSKEATKEISDIMLTRYACKVERKLNSDNKKSLQNNKGFQE